MDNILEFKCVPEKCVYNNNDFKIYGVYVDNVTYPQIVLGKYYNTIIKGNMPELAIDVEYTVKAKQIKDSYGISYQVINIRREKPTSLEKQKLFLREILTEGQATVLLEVYPNIVEMIMKGEDGCVDVNKLKGIGEFTYNKIREKVITNFCLCDIVDLFDGYFSMSIVKKLYDTHSSVDMIKQKMIEDPYACLMKLGRVGFKSADTLLLGLEKNTNFFDYELKSSYQRAIACVFYLLEENEQNGSTYMDVKELKNEFERVVPDAKKHLITILKDEEGVVFDRDKLIICKKSTYDTEKYISDNIKNRLGINSKWECDIEKFRDIGEFKLSDEQMKLLDSVCNKNFTILTSAAGGGKSSSIKALINMLKDIKKSFILCSPTGKAARKLSEYCGEPANTIHRTLGYRPGEFTYKEDNPLACDVLIVDEIGMIDIFLFKSLLKAVQKNTKIVLIGDPYQLNACGAGAILRDLIESPNIPKVLLTKVFRLGKGGALTACTYVRQNKKFLTENKLTTLGEDRSYVFIPTDKEHINDKIAKLYRGLLEKYNYKDITVISSFNIGENGCIELNKLLQPLANKNVNDVSCLKIKQDKTEIKFYKGDLIIQNVNNYHATIFDEKGNNTEETFVANGTPGNIVDIDLKYNFAKIDFDGVIVKYELADLQQIKHGFAVSTHKMQGSQNKIIIFCCPSPHTFFLSNNLLYTAITRAEKMIYHFGDVKTINTAINKSDTKSRKTLLGGMLNE